NGRQHLLAIGSGATPARKKGFLFSELEVEVPVVKEVSLEVLFRFLEESGEVAPAGFINLEGLFATGTEVHLVQRGTGAETSKLITMPQARFEQLLNGQLVPGPELKVLALPEVAVGKIRGGFSGITVFNGRLFL